MAQVKLSTDWTFHGLQVITLQNELLRVQILPEAGAKVWQITYLPLGEELLWNNPRIAPARHSIHARYDDVWSGGWDELFPNDEPAVINGEQYPDHGELWSGAWTAETFTIADTVGVTLRFETPVSAIAVEKRISLQAGSGCLRFQHRFRNLSQVSFPFLWKLHPALKVQPGYRIDFPAMRVVREPAFPGTLTGAPLEFAWPKAVSGEKAVDLREVTAPAQRELYFFYGTEMEGSWCALTNPEKRLSCGLRFEPEVFDCCWLFASYGGWRNYEVAVPEPCTGYPLSFDEMVRAGRQRLLPPGESFSTEVLFSVQTGLSCVSSIEESGVMLGSS